MLCRLRSRLFYDPVRSLVGIAHAGWKGTALGIAASMVDMWIRREGSNPADIRAVIGPAIGSCCYTVDDHVIDKSEIFLFSKKTKPFDDKRRGVPSRIKEVNRQLLVHAGIPNGQIEVSSLCTSCERSLFSPIGETGENRTDDVLHRIKGGIAYRWM
ncbi:laccase domain-containing protein [Bacillus licheniformis]|nr:laccase domain-containing protein [Bacillus licheniformis]